MAEKQLSQDRPDMEADTESENPESSTGKPEEQVKGDDVQKDDSAKPPPRKSKSKKKSPQAQNRVCRHFTHQWDSHDFCLKCIIKGRSTLEFAPPDRVCTPDSPCEDCQDWPQSVWNMYKAKQLAIRMAMQSKSSPTSQGVPKRGEGKSKRTHSPSSNNGPRGCPSRSSSKLSKPIPSSAPPKLIQDAIPPGPTREKGGLLGTQNLNQAARSANRPDPYLDSQGNLLPRPPRYNLDETQRYGSGMGVPSSRNLRSNANPDPDTGFQSRYDSVYRGQQSPTHRPIGFAGYSSFGASGFGQPRQYTSHRVSNPTDPDGYYYQDYTECLEDTRSPFRRPHTPYRDWDPFDLHNPNYDPSVAPPSPGTGNRRWREDYVPGSTPYRRGYRVSPLRWPEEKTQKSSHRVGLRQRSPSPRITDKSKGNVSQRDMVEAMYAIHQDQIPQGKRGLRNEDIKETIKLVLKNYNKVSTATQYSQEEDEEDYDPDAPEEQEEQTQDSDSGPSQKFSPGVRSARSFRSKRWSRYSKLMKDSIPSLPDHFPGPIPKGTRRTVDMSELPEIEEDQAPTHPNLRTALINCAQEMDNPMPRPENKSSNKPGPYGINEVLSTHNRRNFPQFMYPLRVPGFTKPMDPKSKLDKLTTKPVHGLGTFLMNDRDLCDQEMEYKRLISIHSLAHWDHDILTRLREQLRQGLSQEEAGDILDVILDEQKEYLPLTDDMLTTGLTNTILRRRDILLKNFVSLDLSEEAISRLRSSDLMGRSLLEVPPELIKEEQDTATQKTMFHLAKSAFTTEQKPAYNKPRGRGQFRSQNRRRGAYRGRNPYRGRGTYNQAQATPESSQQAQPQQQPQQQQQQQQAPKPNYQYKGYQSRAPRRPNKRGGRGGQQGF